MNELSNEEKKALMYIFDLAVKSVGIADGGSVVNNVLHFTKLMNEEKADQE